MGAMTVGQKGNEGRGRLNRISAENVITVREVIAFAIQSIEPEDRSQRQLFASLMPDLYVMRMKGFGFRQITELLVDCGVQLQLATVRNYYQEMLASKMELCEARFDKQLFMLAKTEEMVDVTAYAAKVIEGKERLRASAEKRINAVLNKQIQPVKSQRVENEVTAQVSLEVPLPKAPKLAEKSTPHSAALVPNPITSDDSSGFGLLAGSSSSIEVQPGAGFISMDEDAPMVPVLKPDVIKQPLNETPRAIPALRCAKLQNDIPPLAVRDEVPQDVYKDGELEHPAVPGLMLKKEERLYGALLEIIDESGELRLETPKEKMFRIKWKKPIPPGETSTKHNFVEMDLSLFRKSEK